MYDADNRVQTPSRVMEEVPAGYRHAGGQLVLSMYNIALFPHPSLGLQFHFWRLLRDKDRGVAL